MAQPNFYAREIWKWRFLAMDFMPEVKQKNFRGSCEDEGTLMLRWDVEP